MYQFKSRIVKGELSFSLFLLLLLVAGSAVAQEKQPSTTDAALWTQFNAAVVDAAVYQPAHVYQLTPLKFDARGRTRVVVLTDYCCYTVSDKEEELGASPWATPDHEVQDKCRTFTDEDLAMRLRELLGLQPNRVLKNFVTMEVKMCDIFRPASDPETTTMWPCQDHETNKACGETFPTDVRADHIQWMAEKMLSSYALLAPPSTEFSYPWTRLGYTYDWKPGLLNRYGASEYVLRKGAKVKVISIIPFAEYCGRR